MSNEMVLFLTEFIERYPEILWLWVTLVLVVVGSFYDLPCGP